MRKQFLLLIALILSVLSIDAQLIKNDFLLGYNVGDSIEKAKYKEGAPGKWDPVKVNQWNLTRVQANCAGFNPKAVAPLVYPDYIESGKGVAMEIPKIESGSRTTVYSLPVYGQGTYYLAFMVSIDFAKKMPLEFFSFDADFSGATQRVRFAVQGVSNTSYKMGLNGSNKTENLVFTESTFDFGTTNLVILKATFDEEGNGTCQLFVNPDTKGKEPDAVISTDLIGLKSIRGITVRQRNGASIAARIGGIRFANSWKAIFK